MNLLVLDIAELCSIDSRVSSYGYEPPRKIGGRCLVKDLDQMIKVYEGDGVESVLFNAVKKISDKTN